MGDARDDVEGRALTDAEMMGLVEEQGCPAGWDRLPRGVREVWLLRHSQSPSMMLKDIGARLGITTGAVARRWARARQMLGESPAYGAVKAGPVGGIGEKGEVGPAQLLSEVEQLLFQSVHEARKRAKIEGASYDHLTRGIKNLNDVRQVLRGEPTKIVRHEDRDRLNETIELVLKEARRRHMVPRFDAGQSATVVDVVPIGEKVSGDG